MRKRFNKLIEINTNSSSFVSISYSDEVAITINPQIGQEKPPYVHPSPEDVTFTCKLLKELLWVYEKLPGFSDKNDDKFDCWITIRYDSSYLSSFFYDISFIIKRDIVYFLITDEVDSLDPTRVKVYKSWKGKISRINFYKNILTITRLLFEEHNDCIEVNEKNKYEELLKRPFLIK